MRAILITFLLFHCACLFAQGQPDTLMNKKDSLLDVINEIVITSSRMNERIFKSPVSISLVTASDINKSTALNAFDAIEGIKGVQVITPSLGFKVINSRGFANTTNVRFSQLIDGIDNQAPHIGAPIANALGANDLDVDRIELVPGTASALYGLNAINGLVNIRTKSPFIHQGISFQQIIGVNHIGAIDQSNPALYTTSNLRLAKAFNKKIAVKANFSYVNGDDWVADNRSDLASSLNASSGLTGENNPAYDEVNGYGNESSNRKTLTLGGVKYVVARTGYREAEITDYSIENMKGDISLYFRPKRNNELILTYKGALINGIYQRSNRFRMEDYNLHQFSVEYKATLFDFRSFLTAENTGRSYNVRSLAENLDRSFKSDNQWFSDFTGAFNNAVSAGQSTTTALQSARMSADLGRFEPGTTAYNDQVQKLIAINNWDQGAALRVKAYLWQTEGTFSWHQLTKLKLEKHAIQLLSGFDYRSYIIIPDGNYFINPVDTISNLRYNKLGFFTQFNKDLLKDKLKISATIRLDKSDYFKPKMNPRLAIVYIPSEKCSYRISVQSGYRFPSIFEGFSNVNSGGVKRVGGLEIMSNGVFEKSYTKVSIDAFQAKVNSDVNTLGITQAQAIANNKSLLKKNPYTYLQPEYVRSLEIGSRLHLFKKRMYIDFDAYFNAYDNFIAQVEASVPNTTIEDSIPTYLYSKSTQSRYRLWTNSKSKIYNYGASVGIHVKINESVSVNCNATYAKLALVEDKDGLEDGFNTPPIMVNGSLIADKFWKGFGCAITGRYQAAYDYVSFLVSGKVPGFATGDLQLNYQFSKPNLQLKIGATNVLNKKYYSILGGPSIGGMYYFSLTFHLLQ